MRIIELSNHPDEMLQDIRQEQYVAQERARAEYEYALARHYARVQEARDRRDQARAQHRWWAWLRNVIAVRGEGATRPSPPVLVSVPTDQQEIIEAGIAGEQMVAAELGYFLDDDWVLFSGYSNNRGEIDHVLLGPRGLFAIEVKHRNAVLYIDGDDWLFEKYDRYGNLVEEGRITDRRGRSPSVQLNQPADELEKFLRRRYQHVPIDRVVIFTHPRSELGNYQDVTVSVSIGMGYAFSLISDSPISLQEEQLTRIERLIEQDHHHHATRASRASL